MSKASKKRFCPAVQREISSGECGENRGSSYQCPAECKFNPFAPENYKQVLEMDTALNCKMMNYLFGDSALREEILRESRRVETSGGQFAVEHWFTWKFFFDKGADGLTCMERWEKAGYPGLKNDERVLMKARQTTRPALIEVQRILDDEQVEVIDCLEADPKPFIARDRSVAARAVRFSTLITWITNQPHYGRFIGAGLTMAEMPGLSPLQVLTEITRHLGSPNDLPGIRVWLAKNFARFRKALDALEMARQELALKAVNSKEGKVLYELRRPFGEARDLLDSSGNVGTEDLSDKEFDEGFSMGRYWIDEEQARQMGGRATPVLGRVLLGQSHWRLEAITEEQIRKLRKEFEKLMGNSVKFLGERFDDHSIKESAGTRYDKDLVPPRLLEKPQRLGIISSRVNIPADSLKSQQVTKEEILADFIASLDSKFLDDSIPALNGKTPREAARDEALRPQLILLMKSRVRSHDQRNLESGRSDDINWMLEELGLQEINFPPPPLRKASRRPPEFAEFKDSEEELLLAKAPDQPISGDEAEELYFQYRKWFENDDDALEEIHESNSDFPYFAKNLAEDFISEKNFALFAPFLLQIRFSMVPPGYLEPEMNYERALADFKILKGQLTDFSLHESGKGLHGFLAGCRHPGLLGFTMAQYMAQVNDMPAKHKPTYEEMLTSTVLLRVMIDELDASLREQAP